MNREEFIAALKPLLKTRGYKKKRHYWYLPGSDLTYCVTVLGSQWSQDDYYVEIGFSIPDEVGETPMLVNWHTRHRCSDPNGESKNIPIHSLLEEMELFSQIKDRHSLDAFLKNEPHVFLGAQIMLCGKPTSV